MASTFEIPVAQKSAFALSISLSFFFSAQKQILRIEKRKKNSIMLAVQYGMGGFGEWIEMIHEKKRWKLKWTNELTRWWSIASPSTCTMICFSKLYPRKLSDWAECKVLCAFKPCCTWIIDLDFSIDNNEAKNGNWEKFLQWCRWARKRRIFGMQINDNFISLWRRKTFSSSSALPGNFTNKKRKQRKNSLRNDWIHFALITSILELVFFVLCCAIQPINVCSISPGSSGNPLFKSENENVSGWGRWDVMKREKMNWNEYLQQSW